MVRIPSRRPPGDQGSSLLEVVIACVLLGIMAAAVLTIVLQSQSAGVSNRNRVAAANLAAREIDIVRDEFGRSDSAPVTLATAGTQVNSRPLTGGTAGRPLVVDGVAYTVTTSVQWNITGNGQSACDGGALVDYPTLGVTVTVTWANMGSVQPVVNSTQLAPPKGTGVPTTDSFIAVKVTDSTGGPNAGRGVRVTGNGTSRTGSTDSAGCAVLQVSPSASAGTSYTAQLTDTDYVDISGTATPSKSVGTVKQGQLNNNVIFQVAKAGTVRLHLVDEAGNPLAAAGGAQITLVASESSGSSGSRSVPVTGAVTTVTGLWPTTYGAFVGSTPPATGYPTGTLTPGGSLDLSVVLTAARASFTDLPAGTSALYAAPDGTTSCTAAGVTQVDPNGVSLLPGSWSFFVSGPTFECSPGFTALALTAGENGQFAWGSTTLQVNGAPAGVLWAVNRGKVTGSFTTCPGPGYESVAVNVDAARGGPVPLPAGDWFIYVTDGAAGGGCVGVPYGQYSKVLTYDTPTVLTWAVQPAKVTVTGVQNSTQYTVFGSPTQLSATCQATGGTAFTRSGTTATGTLGGGTWYIYQRRTSTGACTLGGTVIVGGKATYSLTFNGTSPGTVGP